MNVAVKFSLLAMQGRSLTIGPGRVDIIDVESQQVIVGVKDDGGCGECPNCVVDMLQEAFVAIEVHDRLAKEWSAQHHDNMMRSIAGLSVAFAIEGEA